MDAINRGGHGVFAMQNTHELNQLLKTLGFGAFSLEGYLSMQCAVNCTQAFTNLCNVVEDQAKKTRMALDQFVVIDGGRISEQVALFWLADTDDTHEKFSEVVWHMNFDTEDWGAIRGRCAEFGTTVNGAMEMSEAIENKFAWKDRNQI